jgi:ubiquinone/menaquinone biosynthesis C-methylase UbiE
MYYIGFLRKETQGSNIESIEGDITRPSRIDRSSVDLVYVSTVIHGFSKKELQGFLREVERLLKPNGMLAIVEIEKKETPFGPPLNIRYSPDELKEIVPMAPIDTIRVGEHFYMQTFRRR